MYDKSDNKKNIYGYEIDQAKFWSCVYICGQDDCWLWSRATNTTGYGLFHVRTKPEDFERTGRRTTQLLAHRIAAALYKELQPHNYVMHKCDKRACCNPSHLQIGTQLDNVLDMISKGRAHWQ